MHGIVFFLLASLALASRFKFIVQSVDVGVTRDMQEDDLILAIGTKTNSGTTNSTWALGSVVEGDSIKWDNLTTEIEVPATGSNLSIGIGILNAEATDDKVNATARK